MEKAASPGPGVLFKRAILAVPSPKHRWFHTLQCHFTPHFEGELNDIAKVSADHVI